MSALLKAAKSGVGLSPGGAGALGLAGLGAGVAAISGGEKESGWIVPEGYLAIRERFDVPVYKNGEIVRKRKGLHPHPWVLRKNKMVFIGDRTSSLGDLPIDRDGLTIVSGSVVWGINPDAESDALRKAVYDHKPTDLEQRVVATCKNAFRIIMSTVPSREALKEANGASTSSYHEWDSDDPEIEAAIAKQHQLTERICQKVGEICMTPMAEFGTDMRAFILGEDYTHPYRSIPTNVETPLVATLLEPNGSSTHASAVA